LNEIFPQFFLPIIGDDATVKPVRCLLDLPPTPCGQPVVLYVILASMASNNRPLRDLCANLPLLRFVRHVEVFFILIAWFAVLVTWWLFQAGKIEPLLAGFAISLTVNFHIVEFIAAAAARSGGPAEPCFAVDLSRCLGRIVESFEKVPGNICGNKS
jgi:hypothetical protein